MNRTVLVFTGQGFGPVSNWSILAMSVSPARAMELQSQAVREGRKVKVVRYDDLDAALVALG